MVFTKPAQLAAENNATLFMTSDEFDWGTICLHGDLMFNLPVHVFFKELNKTDEAHRDENRSVKKLFTEH